MPATLELVHLLVLSFFLACAYKALTGKVKQRFTTFLVSLTLALPFYFLLQGNPLNLTAPYYPWGAVLPLSIGVIEALRVHPKTRR
jgi:hypothetical protein